MKKTIPLEFTSVDCVLAAVKEIKKEFPNAKEKDMRVLSFGRPCLSWEEAEDFVKELKEKSKKNNDVILLEGKKYKLLEESN